MKRLLILAALLVCANLAFGQAARYDSVAQSTTIIQTKTIIIPMPNATVTVCGFPAVGGLPCTNKVAVCPDETLVGCTTSAPLNPLTADTQGNFGFWIAAGEYDITVCPINITAGQPCQGPFHVILSLPNSSIPICLDSAGQHLNFDTTLGQFVCGTSIGAHNLLSATHPDTVSKSPPSVGDLIYGSPVGNPPTGIWSVLGIGAAGQVLTVEPKVLGKSSPGWETPTSCDITQVTNWWVDIAGNDTTGTGTNGNPWLTIQHAFDQLPGLVCGRYIINLKTAGTYAGGAVLDGRVFAGGSGGNTTARNHSPFVEWPISDGFLGAAPAYSWVEVTGDPAVSSTFIVSPVGGLTGFSVAGGNLVLRGLKLFANPNNGVGIQVAQGFVSLDAVSIDNFQTGIWCTEGSVCHVDEYEFVDGATNNLEITTSGQYAIIVADDSLFTDYWSDANSTSTGVVVSMSDVGTACMLASFSRVWFRGTVNCTLTAGSTSGIVAQHSRLSMNTTMVDGGSFAATTGLLLIASSFSQSATFGAAYTLKNLTVGASLDSSSFIDQLPTFSGNTQDWSFLSLINGEPAYASGSVNGQASEYMETMTFSATPVFDMTKGPVKKITLTGDITSSTITNPPTTAGIAEFLTLEICQDGAGNHTMVWPANVLKHGTIAATASKCNVQRFIYDVATTSWLSLSAMETGQ